jgi:hypothetical protein
MRSEVNYSALPREASLNFGGVFAIDKKIRKDELGIINFQSSNCYGSHWMYYINQPYLRNILYFDSFGLAPPEKIKTYLLSGKNIGCICNVYVIINVNNGQFFYDAYIYYILLN